MYKPELRALRDRFSGCLLGAALGDALGLPFEGTPAGDLDRLQRAVADRAWQGRVWGYSDDTQMMIDLARSLVAEGGLDRDAMLAALREGYDPVRGYGKGMKLIFAAMDRGADPEALPRVAWPEGSRGNGGVVRLPPLACFYYGHDELVARARRCCAWTHAHPQAVTAGALFASLLDHLLGLPDPDQLDASALLLSLSSVLEGDGALNRRIGAIQELLQGSPTPRDVAASLGHDVLAEASLPAAIYALCAGRRFEDVVLGAIGFGGDTDTIGAMAGALAGARFGAAAIPESWVRRLERGAAEQLRFLADQLLRSWVARITGLA